MKNLLFIGDVVGKSGCDFLAEKLSQVKQNYNIDITVVNAENSAQGNGVTRFSAESIIKAGADILTTGNHAFRQRNDLDIFERDYIIRPANYPEGAGIGKGICILDMGAYSVAVINIMGTIYLDPLDNPFTKIDEILENIDTKNIFVDFHAEATSEKGYGLLPCRKSYGSFRHTYTRTDSRRNYYKFPYGLYNRCRHDRS